jgi:hypothetical protein
MNSIQTRPSELVVPVRALNALRAALVGETGTDMAARALRVAGSAAGQAMFRSLASAAGASGEAEDMRAALDALPQDRFWDAFSAYFASRGWGRMSFSPAHAGVGSLSSPDWVEADPDAGEGRPACFFTTGLLAGLLGRLTASEVAVLEAECRCAGAPRCRFLFGSPAALEAVYADWAAGKDVDASIAALA